jgi:hypothetical protein
MAGSVCFGAVEEATDAEILQLYDTNAFRLLGRDARDPAAYAPRSGPVANISSIGAIDPARARASFARQNAPSRM